MKRIIILAAMLALTLALFATSLPVAAFTPIGVPSTVTVNSGGTGGAPIVKAKWEQSPGTTGTTPAKANETGDPTHATALTQIAPPMTFNASVPVQYYAIVTDPEGIADISTVMVDVYHPTGTLLGAPYADGSFKYQLLLTKIAVLADGKAAYEAAKAAGLVTYQTATTGLQAPYTSYNDAEIEWEFGKADNIAVYTVQGDLYYEQPAGDYRVNFNAFDLENHWASAATPATSLQNFMTYVATAGVDIDFNAFNFGSVNVNQDKWVNGDTTMQTPPAAAPNPNPATVRNIGNVYAAVTVKVSDMGFGYNTEVPTALSNASSAALLAATDWNVFFGARLGNGGTPIFMDPNVTVTLVLPLGLSTQNELDLFIHVIKSPPQGMSGTLFVGANQAGWGSTVDGISSH